MLEAEVLDGVHEECGVFFGSLCVDAVSKVHDVVAAPAIAKDLLRALLREKSAKKTNAGGFDKCGKTRQKRDAFNKIVRYMPANYIEV